MQAMRIPFSRRHLGRIAALLLGTSALCTPASATVIASTGSVTVIVTYADFGDGDFTFRISNQPAGCYGFWLSPAQPGFKTSVAFILKAHSTGEAILVGGNDALIWTGSGSPFCKVNYVGTPY